MRASLTFLLIGTFVAGGYGGLWLARPSMTGHGASHPQYAWSTYFNSANRAAQETSSDTSVTVGKNVASHEANDAERNSVTTGQVDKARDTPAHPEVTRAVTAEQGAGADHDLQTVGSARDHGRSAGDSLPRAKIETEGPRTIGENGSRPRQVRRSSRALTREHRQERFVELLNNPLTLRCMRCLLFGYN